MMKKHPTLLWLTKYAVAGLLLYLLSRQIDMQDVWQQLRQLEWYYLIVVFGFFNISQVVAAMRMRYYYAARGLMLAPFYCIKLYYVSLLYNIVVPGGVGGDAYKVYALKKRDDFKVGEGVKLQVANRTSGLLALCALLFGLAIAPAYELLRGWTLPLLGVMIGVTFIVYRAVTDIFLQETAEEALGAFPYSLAVQACGLAAFAVLWVALGGAEQAGLLNDYLLLFLVAAIVGLIPITMGGLGLRELTFFYGCSVFQTMLGHPMTPELGISLSLMYFTVSTVSSLVGVLWVHKV